MSEIADIIARTVALAMHRVEADVRAREMTAEEIGSVSAAILSDLEAAGFVVTPMEPTDEMYRAAWEVMFQDPYDGTQAAMLGAGYDAMLAERPK